MPFDTTDDVPAMCTGGATFEMYVRHGFDRRLDLGLGPAELLVVAPWATDPIADSHVAVTYSGGALGTACVALAVTRESYATRPDGTDLRIDLLPSARLAYTKLSFPAVSRGEAELAAAVAGACPIELPHELVNELVEMAVAATASRFACELTSSVWVNNVVHLDDLARGIIARRHS